MDVYLNIYDPLNLAHFTRLHVVEYDGNKYLMCQINKISKFKAWDQQMYFEVLFGFKIPLDNGTKQKNYIGNLQFRIQNTCRLTAFL